MRYPGWLYWAVVIASLVAIVTLVLTFAASNACDRGASELLAEIKKANGCFEFWLNRYQSLAAALIGVAVAVYVVRPAFQQLSSLRRQTASQLEARAELHARELEAEREAIRELLAIRAHYDELIELYNDRNFERAYATWHEPFYALLAQLRENARVLIAAELRSAPGAIEAGARTRLVNTLRILEEAAKRLNYAFIANTPVHDLSEPELYSEEECREAEALFRGAADGMFDAHRDYARRHVEAVRQAWHVKNRFAAEAMK